MVNVILHISYIWVGKFIAKFMGNKNRSIFLMGHDGKHHIGGNIKVET